MKTRHMISAIASVSLFGAPMLISAPAASAATSVTVSSGGIASPTAVTDTSITVTNGFITAIDLVSSDLEYLGNACATQGDCRVSSGSSLTLDIAPGAANSTVGVYHALVSGFLLSSFAITYGSGGDASSSTPPAPKSELQQFGKPLIGTCDEAQPAGLDWSGAPSGGWGVSWAQWMNGGLGGEVCTRSLVYSQSTGSWVVN